MTPTFHMLLREPLLHFAAIGVVVYGLSLALRPEASDPRRIFVGHEAHRALSDVFVQDIGRLPSRAEMDRLVERYIQTEALVREARSLRLDEDEPALREHLAYRMQMMMYSGIQVDAPPEDELRAWYEERRDLLATPARMSIRVLGIDAPEADAREIASALTAGGAQAEVAEKHGALTSFEDRPRPQLVSLFGETFVAAIEAGPEGTWRAVPSRRGWQVGRLDALLPSISPDFDVAKPEIEAAWRAEAEQRQAQAVLAAFLARYTTVHEPYGPDVLAPHEAPDALELPAGEAVR